MHRLVTGLIFDLDLLGRNLNGLLSLAKLLALVNHVYFLIVADVRLLNPSRFFGVAYRLEGYGRRRWRLRRRRRSRRRFWLRQNFRGLKLKRVAARFREGAGENVLQLVQVQRRIVARELLLDLAGGSSG